MHIVIYVVHHITSPKEHAEDPPRQTCTRNFTIIRFASTKEILAHRIILYILTLRQTKY